jgi:small-conductance mechanosensitive channel
LESRPCHKDEPWFPSKEGDWVILADGTRGQVVCQSHEMVELELRGGAHQTYLTENFLGLSPTNISQKFRLKVSFGIDYKHQAESTRSIPEKLGEVVRNKFAEAGYKDDIINIRVDFKAASASSLDFEILADFSGSVAQFYGKFSRDIQKFAVEACNQYGWEIPFTQLTIHNQQN